MTLTERYNFAAEGWSALISQHGYAAAYQWLFDTHFQHSVQSVCDVGTGAGDFIAAFAQAGRCRGGITLVDNASNMLAVARRRLQGRAAQLSTFCQPFETLSEGPQYECVLAAHVIEHCADPACAFRKLFTLTKPGGTTVAVISKPHICQLLIWLKWRHRWFASQQVRDFARLAGFSAVGCVALPSGVPSRTSIAYFCHRPQET